MSLEEPILIQNETHAPFERYDLSSLETNGMMRPLAWIEQVAILTVTQDCNATHDDKFRAKLLSIRTTQIHIALNRFKRHLCPSTEKEDARAKWEHLAPNTKNNQGHLARFIDTAHSSHLFAILGSRFELVLRSVEAMAPSTVDIDSDDEDLSDCASEKTRTVRFSIELPEPSSKRQRVRSGSSRGRDHETLYSPNGDIHVHIYL